ncbi:MAG: class I tRNA ligase family protein, partial [bacterium]
AFPADYISEYSGQVRAWFYVLHVLSTALFKSPAFKNVIVSGVIMGTDGRKMSKSFHNYPDPREIIEKYGGDALRLYLMESPTMAWQDMNISEEGIKEQVKKILLTYWNCYNYYTTFAEFSGFNPEKDAVKGTNVLDLWILSRINRFVKSFAVFLDDYHIPEAVRLVPDFLDDLSRWYIRRSRERFKEGDRAALTVLYQVLVLFTKTTAPLMPFITETVYKKLAGDKESVHLEDWPLVDEKAINEALEEKMNIVREIAALALAERAKASIKVRQPLAALTINRELPEEFLDILKQEINVKEIRLGETIKLETELTDELAGESLIREVIRQDNQTRKEEGYSITDLTITTIAVPVELVAFLEANKEMIKKETRSKVVIFEPLSVGFKPGKEVEFKGKKFPIEVKLKKE